MIGERLTGRTVDGGSLWVVIKEGLRRQDFRLHAVREWRELCAWISQSSEEERRGVTSLPRWGSCSLFCGLARVFILPVCARLARGC